MINENSLDTIIKTIFWRVLEVPPEKLNDQTNWRDLEQWDSLGHVLLLEALQEEFQIKIPPEQALDMLSVESIKQTVTALRVDELSME